MNTPIINDEKANITSRLSWILPLSGVVINMALMTGTPPGRISDIIRVTVCGLGFIGGAICGLSVLFRMESKSIDRKNAKIGTSISIGMILIAALAFVMMMSSRIPNEDIIAEINSVNRSCPIKTGNDEILQSAEYKKGEISLVVKMTSVMKDDIVAQKDCLNNAYIGNSTKVKAKYLDRGCTMKYILTDKDGNMALIITLMLSGDKVVSMLQSM